MKVQLKIENELATITLNRPEKLNALDPEMLSALEQMAGQVDQNRKRAPEIAPFVWAPISTRGRLSVRFRCGPNGFVMAIAFSTD